MPVVAVIAAVALDASVVGAAVAGGLAAVSTLSAITAIGATLGAIGAVTHNKVLGLIGAGIGLVGAIGALAFGSDALGSVGELFGTTSGAAGGAAGAVGDAIATSASESGYLPGAVSATDLPAAATTGADITTATGAVANIDPAAQVASSLAPAEGSAAGIVTGGDTGSALGSSLSSAGDSGAAGAAAAGRITGETAMDASIGGDAASQLAAFNGPGGPPGGILNWAKNNQLLSYGVLQAGGSFITGLTNPMTPAQIAALDSQAAANNAAAALTQRQVANLASGMPTANVTGRPAATGGLINNNPNKTPLITGMVNNTSGAPVTGATT